MSIVRLILAIVLVTPVLAGCGDDDNGGADAAATADAAAIGPDAMPAASYQRCDVNEQCPTGEACTAPLAGQPTICQKPCTTETDCPVLVDQAIVCHEDRCGIYCAISEFIPECPAGQMCQLFPGAGDGVCLFPGS